MSQKILYIEDNRNNARLLSKLLHKYPFEVRLAYTATDGLEILENEEIDLLFLDINLPDIDGLTLVEQLKADSRYRNMPIVALTANSMHGDKEMCLDAGFDSYVAKPIMRSELYYIVDHYMGQKDVASSSFSECC